MQTHYEQPAAPLQAAAYVRMSTDHQQYSTDNQLDVITAYAGKHGMKIVKVYSDAGKSGLRAKNREALKQMIADVQSGAHGFAHILIYDVSRFGRFQDTDEAGHYEYVLREEGGCQIHYCMDGFVNNQTGHADLIKMIKREQAKQYSADLSRKVHQGACRQIQLGHRQGGHAGYGFRRMLVDQHGQPKEILQIGQMKAIQTDRVILVPGPAEEVKNISWIYQAFVREGKSEAHIADTLNRRGVATDFGKPWTPSVVRGILTNEKYPGHNVYNRCSFKLKTRHVRNPPDLWVRKDRAFQGLVSQEIFDQAQQLILTRNQKLSDEEMLETLRKLLEKHGHLSGILIDECAETPSSSAFGHRFGSLSNAYKLIGYQPPVNRDFIEINKFLRQRHAEILTRIISDLNGMELSVTRDPQTDLLTVSGEFTVSLVICRHHSTPAGVSRWLIRLDTSLQPDFTLAARMNAANQQVRDYYLLPFVDLTWERLRLAEINATLLDGYRVDSLDAFLQMTRRIPMPL